MRDLLPPNVMSHAGCRCLFGAVRARHSGLVSGDERVLVASAVVAPTGDPLAFISDDRVTECYWPTARATLRVGMAE